MNPKLVLVEILRDAVQDVWDGRRDLLALAALPVVALAVIDVVMMLVLGPLILRAESVGTGEVDPAQAINFLFHIFADVAAQFALCSIFAVAWHRRYLVPGENLTALQAILWDGRKLRYMFRIFVVAMVATLFSAVPGGVVLSITANEGLATIAFGACFMVVMGRLSLVFPATAVDAEARLSHIWLLGKGSTFQLISVLVIPTIIFSVGGAILLKPLIGILIFFDLDGSLTGIFVVGLIKGTIGFCGYAVLTTIQSIAWLKLTQRA